MDKRVDLDDFAAAIVSKIEDAVQKLPDGLTPEGDALWMRQAITPIVKSALEAVAVQKGGTLHYVGWYTKLDEDTIHTTLDEAVDVAGDGDITDLQRVYLGPTEFVARIIFEDETGDGQVEYFFKPTEEEAKAFLASAEAKAIANGTRESDDEGSAQ